MQAATVVNAIVLPADRKLGRSKAIMMAVMSDNSWVDILEWYDDEISFTPAEVLGLTSDECWNLFHTKDVAYLRS